MMKIKFKNKKVIALISLVIILILILILTFSIRTIIVNNEKNLKPEELSTFSWETKMFTINEDYTYTFFCVVIVQELDGIDKIEYEKNGEKTTINCNGNNRVALDFEALENVEYEFKITPIGQEEKIEILKVERKVSGKDTYKLVNGIYVNTPFLENFNSKYTRYLSVTENDTLTPGNWIADEEPQNWYDYNNQKWANLYVEYSGINSYWVWIPRYVYKEAEGQRIDAKFVDVYNNYKDANGNTITWGELIDQGYQLPEAFQFHDTSISGYWISKYQLSEHTDSSSFVVYFETTATTNSIKVQNMKTASSAIVKYQYAIDGKVMHESDTPEDYTFTGLEMQNRTINVTALNANNEIVGSYTTDFEIADVNEPDITKFDKDTTFYVYWDEEGNEHNEIPISEPAPKNWYNYSIGNWANIVTRNNGVESYWVWIPRYQFKVNTTTQRTVVKFIKGTSSEAEYAYQIPEAFTFAGKELEGYWIAKHQLSTETSEPKVNAEMSAGSSLIRILDITGTSVAEGQKYEYYLNGVKKYEGTDSKEHYVFEGLEANTTYTINIIVRNNSTNAYVGAVTKKVITTEANAPDISAFDKSTTYYVTYNDDGTEKRTLMSEVETPPDDWYDYSAQKWANIVTTANGRTAYWVWIPRYELRILGDRGVLSTANRRTEVNFLSGTTKETTIGYQIPEAFTFAGKELSGYWIAKYQMSN